MDRLAVFEGRLLAQAGDSERLRPQRPQPSKTGLHSRAQKPPSPPQGAKNVLKLKEY